MVSALKVTYMRKWEEDDDDDEQHLSRCPWTSRIRSSLPIPSLPPECFIDLLLRVLDLYPGPQTSLDLNICLWWLSRMTRSTGADVYTTRVTHFSKLSSKIRLEREISYKGAWNLVSLWTKKMRNAISWMLVCWSSLYHLLPLLYDVSSKRGLVS